METYIIVIDEYQRKLIIDLMRHGIPVIINGLKESNGNFPASNTRLEEALSLLTMLGDIPQIEKEDSKTVHGLCL